MPIGKQQLNKMKRKILIGSLLCAIFSCNKIETSDTLSKSDIKYLEKLQLLDRDEKIYKFYSEFNFEHAGNFYTNKRIASYWIDSRNSKKNMLNYAYYRDIKSIDTIYNAGATYSPYMLITDNNGKSFKVSVNGKKDEIKSFFEGSINQWKNK